MKRISALRLTILLAVVLAGCGDTEQAESSAPSETSQTDAVPTDITSLDTVPPEGFILISGGTFQMGSHGGGRFGQSLTAITKLAPDAVLGEGLAVSYSGGSGLASDVTDWLEENNISAN